MTLQRPSDAKRKQYFAYEIQISFGQEQNEDNEDQWIIMRRYSDFHRLHKYLQKDNVAIKLLDFPPKKSFGNMVSTDVFLSRNGIILKIIKLFHRMQNLWNRDDNDCKCIYYQFFHFYQKYRDARLVINSNKHFHFSD